MTNKNQVAGTTIRINTACKSLFVIHNPGIQCFVIKGKSGTCLNSMCEAIGRLASELIALGHTEKVIHHLKNIKCGNSVPYKDGEFVESCADAIAKALIQGD